MSPERKPDIAFFIGSFGGGGIERTIAHLTHGFIAQGLNVDLVLDRSEGSHLYRLPPEVRIVNLGAPKLYASLPNLITYLKQYQPIVLISASHYMNEIALLAKKFARVTTRVVISEHNQLSKTVQNATHLKHWLTPWFARFLYPWADNVIAVSRGVAEDLSITTGFPLSKIQVIYNPVVTPKILEDAREPIEHPWFYPGEPPVILGVGKLEEQKDFPNLIRAFAEVRKERQCRLMILGWGPDRSQLEALIYELGLDDAVAMPGYIKNPYSYMSRAAVFVLSSAWEGLPTVLIEAMAVGVPVVSTDCPSGPSEILEDGKYGFLTPVNNSKALAGAILEVLDSKFKEASSDWLNQFSLEFATQQYLNAIGISKELR